MEWYHISVVALMIGQSSAGTISHVKNAPSAENMPKHHYAMYNARMLAVLSPVIVSSMNHSA